MSFDFHLAEINKLGDNDEQYGQKYWGHVSDDLVPISFNSKNQDIKSGDNITAEEKAMKKTQKGVTYWQLKKVQLVGGSALPTVEASLKRIEEKLDRLLGLDEALTSEQETIDELIENVDE